MDINFKFSIISWIKIVLHRYMVTPLMDLDLNNIIKIQKLTDDQVKFIIYQIMRGLKYIHSAGIIHRLVPLFE